MTYVERLKHERVIRTDMGRTYFSALTEETVVLSVIWMRLQWPFPARSEQ